jgi:hypothetical protein
VLVPESLSSRQDEVQKNVAYILERIEDIACVIRPLIGDYQDQFLYTESKISKGARPETFKESLIRYYYNYYQGGAPIKCMFSEIVLPSQIVIGSHLFKHAWAKKCKDVLGIGDINDPRNGLLLFKPFEFAFDNSHICFQYEEKSGFFAMKILDTRLRSLTIKQYILQKERLDKKLLLKNREDWETSYKRNSTFKVKMEAVDNLIQILNQSFSSFEGRQLNPRENGTSCYSRCLSFQAKMAKKLAIREGWITKEDLNGASNFSDMEDSKKKFIEKWIDSLTFVS